MEREIKARRYMYLLSDKKPNRKTQSENITTGSVKRRSNFDTLSRIPRVTIRRIKKMCHFLICVFSILEMVFSKGKINEISMVKSTKLIIMFIL